MQFNQGGHLWQQWPFVLTQTTKPPIKDVAQCPKKGRIVLLCMTLLWTKRHNTTRNDKTLSSYPRYNNHTDKTSVKFALTNDTPYLALPGELWGVFRELYKE